MATSPPLSFVRLPVLRQCCAMTLTPIESPDAPTASGGYSQALAVGDARRLLFISGQIPEARDGTVPTAFADQCRLVWSHIEAQLRAAGMGLDDLVKVTTFLSDRAYAEENGAIRREV